MSDSPARLFRLNVEVGDLRQAAVFYGALFEHAVRLDRGARFYLNAGDVTLQVVEISAPHIAAKALYFAVDDLDAWHRRCTRLGCLSGALVHDVPAGQPAVRPWGERSFYADDPWGNPLCFVDEASIYRG